MIRQRHRGAGAKGLEAGEHRGHPRIGVGRRERRVERAGVVVTNPATEGRLVRPRERRRSAGEAELEVPGEGRPEGGEIEQGSRLERGRLGRAAIGEGDADVASAGAGRRGDGDDPLLLDHPRSQVAEGARRPRNLHLDAGRAGQRRGAEVTGQGAKRPPVLPGLCGESPGEERRHQATERAATLIPGGVEVSVEGSIRAGRNPRGARKRVDHCADDRVDRRAAKALARP